MPVPEGRDTIALVTGGASGLGAAIARLFADAGHRVVLTDIDFDRGTALAQEIGGVFLQHDVAEPADWQRVMSAIEDHFGRLDILVNNAGITIVGTIEDLDLTALRRTLDVDLIGVFLGCQAAIGLMKRNGGGLSLTCHPSPACGHRPVLPVITPAKAGMTLMSKSIALHCAESGYNIRCNTVHPGVIHTAMLDKVAAQVDDPRSTMASYVAASPLGRIGEPDDVAEMVLFLTSDRSKFVTGGGIRR